MANPIVRIFETEQQAREAVRRLAEDGYPEGSIYLVTPSMGGGEEEAPVGAGADTLAAALKAGSLMSETAEVYAERVERGRSLVAVPAAFGFGRRAAEIMDEVGPVDTDIELPEDPYDFTLGTPFSSTVCIPVLARSRPAPLSGLIGVTPLVHGRTTFGTLTNPHYTASSSVGLKVLGGGASPFSSLFGLKLLTTKKRPWNMSFGLPLLSRAAAPLSSMFGLKILSKSPTPLSSLLRFRTLLPEYR
jgi:hypothetical protein